MKKWLLVFLLLLSAKSFALGIMVDPYFGLIFDGESEWGSSKYDHDGIGYGSRFGVSHLGLIGGLDYSLSSPRLQQTEPISSTEKATYEGTFLGAFVGYNFPGVRLFFEYFFDAEFEGDNNTFDGTGRSIGAGLTSLKPLAVNLEYRSFKFDGNNGVRMKSHEYFLTVSFPMDFPL